MATPGRLKGGSRGSKAEDARIITDNEMRKFVEVMRKESWRKHIHIRNYQLNSLKILRDGMLKHKLTAGVFDLSGSVIESNQISYIGEIVTIAGIKRLVLKECCITPQSVGWLTEGIMERTTDRQCELKHLDLCGNEGLECKEGAKEIHKLMIVTSVNVVKLNAFTIEQSGEDNMERALSFSMGMPYIEWGVFVDYTTTCMIERFVFKKMPFPESDANLFIKHALNPEWLSVKKVTIELGNSDGSFYKFVVDIIIALNTQDVFLSNTKGRSQTRNALTELKTQLSLKKDSTFHFKLSTALSGMSNQSWELIMDIVTICRVETLEMTFEPGNMAFMEVFKKYKQKVSTLIINDDGYDNFECVLVTAWQVLPFVSKQLMFKNFRITMDTNLLEKLITQFYGKHYTVESFKDTVSISSNLQRCESRFGMTPSLGETTEDLINLYEEPICQLSGLSVSDNGALLQKATSGDKAQVSRKGMSSPQKCRRESSMTWSSSYSEELNSLNPGKRFATQQSFGDIYSPNKAYSSSRPSRDYDFVFDATPDDAVCEYNYFREITTSFSERAQYFHTIDLSNRALQATDITKLAAVVVFFDNLQNLALTSCNLNGEATMEVTRGLTKKPDKMMMLLDLSSNPGMGEIGSKAIADLISTRHIQNIKVADCGLEKWHKDVVSPSLTRMPMKVGHHVAISYAENRADLVLHEDGGSVDFANYGCRIDFPPGCVSTPTKLSFKIKTPDNNLEEGTIPVTPMLQCFPSGTTFLKQVKIRLSTWIKPKSRIQNSVKISFNIFTREQACDTWCCMVGNFQHGRSDFIEFETDHFSDFEAAMNNDQAPQAEGNYCNMLFVPQVDPLHHKNQTLVSWIVPNNAAVTDGIKRRCAESGTKLYDGGEMPLRVTEADQLTVSATQYQAPNMEPILILPDAPAVFPGATIFQSPAIRHTFAVKLTQQNHPNEQKTADLCHKVLRNADVIIEDPFTVRWRPRNEPPETVQHNYYNVYNITNPGNVMIAANGGSPVPQVVQQLEEVVVPALQDEAEEEDGAAQQ